MPKKTKKQPRKVIETLEQPKSNASLYAATLLKQVEAELHPRGRAPLARKKKVGR
jgi:hypothetical protein